MPAESKVESGGSNLYYISDSTTYNVAAAGVAGEPVYVPSTNHFGGTPIYVTVSGFTTCLEKETNGTLTQYPSGTLNIVVTTPNNNKTTIPITVTGDTVP